MTLRLGFHYHIPASLHEGHIFMPGYLGRFIDSLAAHCEHVVCFMHSPLPSEQALMDYRLTSPQVTLVDIGPHVSVPRRLLGARRLVRPVREWRSHLDVMLIRGPTPLLAGVAGAAGGLPLVLLLVGDMLAGINDMPQPRWRKEAIRLMWRWNHRQQLRLAQRSLTFVNSRRLYEQLRPSVPQLYETRTTTLSKADFFHREDTCTSPPYHLLYTGRMARQKGLLEMVEALAILAAQGRDVILDLVGWPGKDDDIIEQAQVLSQERGIAARVRYHGYKALGPELFAYYRQADIFVIASIHEGFPRSIWEAMAHSLPVVATRVGSIPDFIQGAAELVEARNVSQLAASIQKIIDDGELRGQLINKGMALASENTLEFQVAKMMDTIKEQLRRRE